MHQKITTSLRTHDFKEYVVWEEITHTLVRAEVIDGKVGMPDFHEPERVNVGYHLGKLEEALGYKFEDGTHEFWVCPDTLQQSARGWVPYNGKRYYYSFSYTGDNPFKADMERLLHTMRLNMGIDT
jgi:hypothetical protein